MSPLALQINSLTSGQPEAYRILLMKECEELGIAFICDPEFGFISDRYPDTPFLSLASLVMLERIQSWLELDFRDANLLMIALYRSDSDDLSFVEGRSVFLKRMTAELLRLLSTPKAND